MAAPDSSPRPSSQTRRGLLSSPPRATATAGFLALTARWCRLCLVHSASPCDEGKGEGSATNRSAAITAEALTPPCYAATAGQGDQPQQFTTCHPIECRLTISTTAAAG